MHKIFMFVPAFGQQITATTFLTTHALQQAFMSKGIGGGVSTLSFPDIAELREIAMTIWYDTMPDVEHLLFIDADMGFPPDMVLDMLLFNEGVVGTIYPQRRLPVSWAGSGTGDKITERRGNFMRVEGVGMGCTLIRRDVVTALIEKMPEMVDTRIDLHPSGDTLKQAGAGRLMRFFEKMDMPQRGVISEDLSFCIRAAQVGFPCWAAIGWRISHVGPYDYGARYLDMVEAAERAQQQQIALPQTAGGSTVAESVQVVQANGLPLAEQPPAAEHPVNPAAMINGSGEPALQAAE